jgi:hypothetical protein
MITRLIGLIQVNSESYGLSLWILSLCVGNSGHVGWRWPFGLETQIWTAISVYVLVTIAKKKLKLEHSPYEILQYISLAHITRSWRQSRIPEKARCYFQPYKAPGT